MNFRVGGALGLVCGVALVALAWFGRAGGRYLLLAAFLGPMLVFLGTAFALLPADLLVIPKERDGRRVYETKTMADYTPLAKGVAAAGLAAGAAYALWLMNGA